MITRFNPPFRSAIPPQWRGACAAVAGGGPNRATAIVVARLVFTISGQSRAFTALRLIDLVTAVHSHLNELATLEFGLQQLARLEDELAPDGAVPGPLMLALSSRTRIGTVERANAIAAATLPAEAQRRLTVMPVEITTGYRRPDGQWPPRCPVAWLVHEFNARVASHVDAPDPHDRRLGPDQFVVSLRHYRPAESELSRERLKSALSTAEGLLLQPRGEGELIELIGRRGGRGRGHAADGRRRPPGAFSLKPHRRRVQAQCAGHCLSDVAGWSSHSPLGRKKGISGPARDVAADPHSWTPRRPTPRAPRPSEKRGEAKLAASADGSSILKHRAPVGTAPSRKWSVRRAAKHV